MPRTQVQAEKTQPKDKPFRLYDIGGFYLEVMPNGGKYWRLSYRYRGQGKAPGPGDGVTLLSETGHGGLLNHGPSPESAREANSGQVVVVVPPQREWLTPMARSWVQSEAK